MVNGEFCFIKNGVVENVAVSDAANANACAAACGCTAVQRTFPGVWIKSKYHDGAFWKDVFDLCPGGMTHPNQVSICAGGEKLNTTHEEEIVA